MWQIIKNELKYSRNIIITDLLVISVFMLYWIIWGQQNPEKSYSPLRMIYLNAMLLLLIARIARQFKEKTLRIHAVLPLPAWKIGLARLLSFSLVVIGTLTGFALIVFIAKPEFTKPEIVRDWFMLAGVLLLVNVLPHLHRDLTRWFSGIFGKVIITLFYILILLSLNLMYYFFIRLLDLSGGCSWLQPFKENFYNFVTDPGVTLFLLLLIPGFIFLSILVFQKRKTYLD